MSDNEIKPKADATKVKKRRETELGELIVRNMAVVLEREREARGMTKTDFKNFLDISAPTYFGILDGTANPTIFVVTRISEALRMSIYELLTGQKREK